MIHVEARNLPRHVAIIMDGNGRWAERRGLPRTEGHRRGSDAVREVVRAARRLGIGALTLFAFSEQNWGRPEGEVTTLMALLRDFILGEHDNIVTHRIALRAIGDLARLPESVTSVLDPLAAVSSSNAAMVLTLALSYGGREEIAQAARAVAVRVASGQLRPEDVTPAQLEAHMPSAVVGHPDLMVRTGGEMRISNFLLWGAAYSELHFSDVLWPDFGADDFYQAVSVYQQRERRFGLTGAQTRLGTMDDANDLNDARPSAHAGPGEATTKAGALR